MIRPVLTILCALACTAPFAGESGPVRKVDTATLELEELPKFDGVSVAFIEGAFDEPGLYMAQSRMEKGSVFPAHSHPDIRITVVLSGTMHLGTGAVSDGNATSYPAGTMAVTPAGTTHWMSAPDGDVMLLEIGSGPSGMAWAKP